MSSFMVFFRPPDTHHQGNAGKVSPLFRRAEADRCMEVGYFYKRHALFFYGSVSRPVSCSKRRSIFPSCFLYASKLKIFPYVLYGKQGRAPDVLLDCLCPRGQRLKGQTMQQGIQIVSGVAQGRFLLGQQPRRRIEHEATSVFGRLSCYLAISVQSVR